MANKNVNRVSISESRCFSFQGCDCVRNFSDRYFQVSISESRCFSFQVPLRASPDPYLLSFNLGIEMLFVSSELKDNPVGNAGVKFQSRNRDAFRFKLKNLRSKGLECSVSISESRCFSFQVDGVFQSRHRLFNVSISESRCFSFQAISKMTATWDFNRVSISESRCFSFQVV